MNKAVFILIAAVIIFGNGAEARAFWGGDTRLNSSGLDVNAGYDVNTVTTITGTVISPPSKADSGEHTQMIISTGKETATVLLGPWSYWEKQGCTINRDQEISVTGSRAQGKDGSTYLFAQRLDNKASGITLSLRSETGTPAWSHSGTSGGAAGNRGVQRYGRGAGGAGYRNSMGGGGRR